MEFKKISVSQQLCVNTLQDLKDAAYSLLPLFSEKQIVLLNGPMASGKTTFVHETIKALGGGAQGNSPTFAIHQTYLVGGDQEVDHVDLYRLKNDYDLETTGFWDLFERHKGLIFVEWADRLEGHWWPNDWGVLQLDFTLDGNNRTIKAISIEH